MSLGTPAPPPASASDETPIWEELCIRQNALFGDE